MCAAFECLPVCVTRVTDEQVGQSVLDLTVATSVCLAPRILSIPPTPRFRAGLQLDPQHRLHVDKCLFN